MGFANDLICIGPLDYPPSTNIRRKNDLALWKKKGLMKSKGGMSAAYCLPLIEINSAKLNNHVYGEVGGRSCPPMQILTTTIHV